MKLLRKSNLINMAKFVHKRISYDEQDRLLEELCAVLGALRTPKERKYFLKDLLGRGERVMLVRRFKIAKLLEEEKTYNEIMKILNCGRATIAKIEKLLNFGRNGYRIAIGKVRKIRQS